MSHNNILSAKAQHIIDKFINENRNNTSISRTDIMKHVVVTLYAQMPEAKPELIAPFKDCIFDLHDYFTQEEVSAIVAECPQAIMYCFKSSGAMRHFDFSDGDNELVEDIVSEDTPLNIYKTPECIIGLCARLSGKPAAHDKVYMPYSDFADYALYNPEAEYHIECGDQSCGLENVLKNYTNAYIQILLDSQNVKSHTVYVDDGLERTDIEAMHPDYVFACNPVLGQRCDDALSYSSGMCGYQQNVEPSELGGNIALWLYSLTTGGSIDLVLPQRYFCEAGIWTWLKVVFESNKIEFNAAFIKLNRSVFDYGCESIFLLHLEKGNGNNGMMRLVDATGLELYWRGKLDVDLLMGIINQKECNSKYEERMHYTTFFAGNRHVPHQYLIDKKLPVLAEDEKYITLRALVDVVPTANLERYCKMRVLAAEDLCLEYMDCGIDPNSLLQERVGPTDLYSANSDCFSIDKDCLVAGLYCGTLNVGKLENVVTPIALRHVVPFRLKSSAVTEEFLLRELTKDYCTAQSMMLVKYRERGRVPVIDCDNFLDIKIAVPSLEEQERRCKCDAQAYLKEADRKIIQASEEFQRDVHMKKHAIGQTLFNLGNWWNLLLKARKEGNGIVDDRVEIGKKNKVQVSDIYDNIQTSLEKLQMQVDRFWATDGFKTQNLSLDAFVKEYVASHHSPMFTYRCVIEPSLAGKSDIVVAFAKEALVMVFDNIINNACSHGFGYSDSDKNFVKVEIGKDNSPYIIISNNGRPFHGGLTAEDVFTYGRSSSSGQHHYGIGGYEVRNIMRKFGGEVEFVSTPDDEFTVSYKLTFKHTSNIKK